MTNVGGCPKVKTNITKFTVCDSSDERKKIQLAQVRNKVLPVQDQYRAFVPVYILKKWRFGQLLLMPDRHTDNRI